CWSLSEGYPCCQKNTTKVKYISKSTGKEWGIENDNWCGITDLQRCPKYGKYKCCQSCKVKYVDSEEWGYENGEWCSIPYSCKDSTNN
ncbi:Non-catalytic module family DOC2, partial [Piromyces sp. E2]